METVEEVPADFSFESWGESRSRPVHVFEGSRHAFGELGRVLNLVQAGKVRIQAKSRRPTGGTERLLAGALAEPDFDLEPPPEERDGYTKLAGPVRAHAWGVLVQQSGWCKPHGGKLTLTKAGRLGVLAVSKVANFAVDLPDASVAIQISGTFGSRQEEAQRLGRILRPKPGENQAHFYSIVSADTVEQEFALKRQLFLCEQGYAYEIRDADANGNAIPDYS